MHVVNPKILFAWPLFGVSAGYHSHPKRNRRQCICKILDGNNRTDIRLFLAFYFYLAFFAIVSIKLYLDVGNDEFMIPGNLLRWHPLCLCQLVRDIQTCLRTENFFHPCYRQFGWRCPFGCSFSLLSQKEWVTEESGYLSFEHIRL